MKRKTVLALLVLVLFVCLAACQPQQPKLKLIKEVRLTCEAPQQELSPEKVSYSVSGTDENGKPVELTATLRWQAKSYSEDGTGNNVAAGEVFREGRIYSAVFSVKRPEGYDFTVAESVLKVTADAPGGTVTYVANAEDANLDVIITFAAGTWDAGFLIKTVIPDLTLPEAGQPIPAEFSGKGITYSGSEVPVYGFCSVYPLQKDAGVKQDVSALPSMEGALSGYGSYLISVNYVPLQDYAFAPAEDLSCAPPSPWETTETGAYSITYRLAAESSLDVITDVHVIDTALPQPGDPVDGMIAGFRVEDPRVTVASAYAYWPGGEYPYADVVPGCDSGYEGCWDFCLTLRVSEAYAGKARFPYGTMEMQPWGTYVSEQLTVTDDAGIPWTVAVSLDGDHLALWYSAGPVHSFTHVDEVGATCTEDGMKEHYACSLCGKLFTAEDNDAAVEPESLIVPATGHNIRKVPAKEPTCTEPGNKAYYTCSNCGKNFFERNGTKQIKRPVLNALGHDLGKVYDYDEKNHYYRCSRCGTIVSQRHTFHHDGVCCDKCGFINYVY